MEVWTWAWSTRCSLEECARAARWDATHRTPLPFLKTAKVFKFFFLFFFLNVSLLLFGSFCVLCRTASWNVRTNTTMTVISRTALFAAADVRCSCVETTTVAGEGLISWCDELTLRPPRLQLCTFDLVGLLRGAFRGNWCLEIWVWTSTEVKMCRKPRAPLGYTNWNTLSWREIILLTSLEDVEVLVFFSFRKFH